MGVELRSLGSAAVLGAGSAGMRHSSLLEKLRVPLRLFSRRTESDELASRMTTQGGWDDFDYIVLAIESSGHSDLLNQLASVGFRGKVLVEKPAIVLNSELDFLSVLDVKVAYNLRYLDGLAYVKDLVASEKTLSASLVCRSDLSSWRENNSHPRQYSRYLSLGGGALYDLSHELDYFLNIFGEPELLQSIGGRLGEVTQDSDDNWKILAGYFTGLSVSLELSLLSQFNQRTLFVELQGRTVLLDLVSGSLIDSVSGEQHFNSIKTTSERLLRDWIFEGGDRLPDLVQNMRTLNFIERVRYSNVRGESFEK